LKSSNEDIIEELERNLQTVSATKEMVKENHIVIKQCMSRVITNCNTHL
jgi:hypothetical protein